MIAKICECGYMNDNPMEHHCRDCDKVLKIIKGTQGAKQLMYS